MRILKLLSLAGLAYLAITVDNIYIKTGLIIVISCYVLWTPIFGKPRGEYIWKLLWDEYDASTFAKEATFKTTVSINSRGFRVNASETESGLLIERTWLPEIIRENRGSGPIILIPWVDINTAKILPMRGKNNPYVLMFKLKGNYDVKLYWNADRLKYCASERLM
tara:strand:+ start:106 stop:600 length:495 start_codon:yes stop_codon:yes gene_type:complete